MAPTVAPKRKGRRGRAKSPKPKAKGNGRSTSPSAKSRERASAAAAVDSQVEGRKASQGGGRQRRHPPPLPRQRRQRRPGRPGRARGDPGGAERRPRRRLLRPPARRRRGLMGDIAAAYNELVDRNARMTKELDPHRPRDRPRGPHGRARLARASSAATGRRVIDSINGLIDDLVAPDHRGRARDRRRGRRRPRPEDGAHDRGPAGQGRVPAHRHDGEHDGRPALARSPTRSRAWRARWAPRASSAARPRCAACPARGAT